MPEILYLLFEEIAFWQALTVILLAICLSLVVYKPWRYPGKKKLKRLARLEKSQGKLLNSGMNWDERLSKSQIETAKKLATLDLKETAVKIREVVCSLEQNGIKNTRKYNKGVVKVIRLKRIFANMVYVVSLAGLEVSNDPFSPAYNGATEKVEEEPKTQDKESQSPEEKEEVVEAK